MRAHSATEPACNTQTTSVVTLQHPYTFCLGWMSPVGQRDLDLHLADGTRHGDIETETHAFVEDPHLGDVLHCTIHVLPLPSPVGNPLRDALSNSFRRKVENPQG